MIQRSKLDKVLGTVAIAICYVTSRVSIRPFYLYFNGYHHDMAHSLGYWILS